ncbi:MAG: hypothetical protein ACRYGR_02250 [Janthinobacterium lividum]
MTSSIPPSSPQMILNLETKLAYCKEDFFIGPSNKIAFETLMTTWPRWPACGQIVVGPQGSGKTHLATIWQTMTQGIFLKSDLDFEKLHQDLRNNNKKPAVILDFNEFPGEMTESILFHLYNLVNEYQGHLLILSRHLPQTWPLTLPDLKSRLFSLPVQQLNDPDDEVLGAVLRKRFSDYQMVLSENVFAYVISRIDRSFKAIHDFTDRVNLEALSRKKNINLSLAKMCLGSVK